LYSRGLLETPNIQHPTSNIESPGKVTLKQKQETESRKQKWAGRCLILPLTRECKGPNPKPEIRWPKEGRNPKPDIPKPGFGPRNSDLGGWRRVVLSRYARTAGGGHCNLDKAPSVSILGMATVGGREAGRLDRIGARAEGGRQGRRARVLACPGCRDLGAGGNKERDQEARNKQGTS